MAIASDPVRKSLPLGQPILPPPGKRPPNGSLNESTVTSGQRQLLTQRVLNYCPSIESMPCSI